MNAPATSATVAKEITEPRARFRDLLAAEWTKLWSLRSTYGSLALIMLAAIGFSANAALADYHNWPTYSADRRALFNPLRDAFPEQAYLFVMLAAGSMGAITIVGEYATGLIRTTFAAVPHRRSVVTAKITLLTAVMLAVGAIAAATSFGVSQAILSGRQAGYSIGNPGALQAIAASTLLVPVCALVGTGIGALIRHAAPTIVTTAVVLLLLPTAFDDNRRWQAAINHALPLSAWEHLIDTRPAPSWVHIAYPPTVTGSWTVYMVWPLVAAIAAVIVAHRRDP
jgi:ABC-2 type transport system permease protein